MRKQDQKDQSVTSQPDQARKQTDVELSDEALKQATGGKVTFQDFHFVQKVNKSSPG